MNFQDWYTDTVDVYRVQDVSDGALTRKKRVQVLSGIPCRVYEDNERAVRMAQTAAGIEQESKLACGNDADIRAGDELIVHRGGGLKKAAFDTRAFAGDPHYYFEPFGAVLPGLAHQEIRLLQQERVKGGGAGDAQAADKPAESESAPD